MIRPRVVVGAAAAAVFAAAHVLILLVLAAGPAAAHGEGGPPAEGSYTVDADVVPDGVDATILQGRKPGVFLQASTGTLVEVIDEDGTVLARATPQASQVSWLDDRLRPPSQPPAETGEDAVVGRWEIPVRVDGRPDILAGEIRWVSLGYPAHQHDSVAWYASWPATTAFIALCLTSAVALAVVVDRRRGAASVAVARPVRVNA